MSRRPSLALLLSAATLAFVAFALIHDVALKLAAPLMPLLGWLSP